MLMRYGEQVKLYHFDTPEQILYILFDVQKASWLSYWTW
jgi:hypothetical protein